MYLISWSTGHFFIKNKYIYSRLRYDRKLVRGFEGFELGTPEPQLRHHMSALLTRLCADIP